MSGTTDMAELKRQIEIAERVLRETRNGGSYNWARDYFWLKDEHARLQRQLELSLAQTTE